MVKVSIIVPVYNVEHYLEECIKSVIEQTYKNIELILVDDGSTDKSGKICDNYSSLDERIIVIHKNNGGLSSARNVGLEAAQGRYIIFIDSDDYWIGNNCLLHMVNLAETYNADVVRGEYISINEKGERIRTITKDKQDVSLCLLDSADFYIRAIAGENFSVLFLFRKDAINTLRFNENLAIQEDIDFNIKFFALDHKCIYTNEAFYVYRKRANSITTLPQTLKLIDSFYLCDVFDEFSRITQIPKLRAEYEKQSVLKYLRTLSTMAEEPYFSNLSEIAKDIKLNSIYLKALKRVMKYRVIGHKGILAIFPPQIYIMALHLKIVLYKLFIK